MLVLSRKPGEKVVIGNGIIVTVAEVKGNRVRLAFEAPGDVKIMRSELLEGRDDKSPPAADVDADLANKPSEWHAEPDAKVQPTHRIRGYSKIIPHRN
jgi:carbon storage regulator